MRINEFRELLDAALPKRKKLLAVGPAGIGKTQIPTELAKLWNWDVKALCMPLLSPVFLMGYPFRDNGTAGHAPFGVLGECLRAEKDTLLLLDELGGASGETIKAGLRLLQFGEVGDKRLPDCVRILALSNDVGHGADVMGIIEPMKDRFDSIVNVEPHVEDTTAYGLARDWPAWILAFLRNCPEALHDLKPLKSMQRSGATPRGWEAVAQLEKDGLLDGPFGVELVQGAVGKGRAVQALAFRKLAGELPDIDAVLMDPTGQPVPDNPSARFLVASAISSRMTAGNFGACIKYLNRMDGMFMAYSVRDSFRAEVQRKREKNLPKDWKPLASSRDYTAWAVSPQGKEVLSAAS